MSGPKSSGKSNPMHRRISAHKVDRSASKSTPLNSHLVLSSLMYFRSISTAPGVHDHFLGFFVADSGAKDAFLFPCDFFDFSRGKVLFHIFPSRAAFSRTLVDTWFIIGLLAKCRHCCPPTVPNSVPTIWPAQKGENILNAYTRAAI